MIRQPYAPFQLPPQWSISRYNITPCIHTYLRLLQSSLGLLAMVWVGFVDLPGSVLLLF